MALIMAPTIHITLIVQYETHHSTINLSRYYNSVCRMNNLMGDVKSLWGYSFCIDKVKGTI